jgi:hypothetical protein
MEDLLKLK